MRLGCLIGRHKPSGKSLIPFADPNSWLKKCMYCNRYIMHGYIGQCTCSERKAKRLQEDAFAIFPYMKGCVDSDQTRQENNQ